MKLLLVGSANICDFDLARYIGVDVDEIIAPGETAIGDLAEKYADARHLSKHIIYPKFHLYDNDALMQRNREMVEMADRVLIIFDEESDESAFITEYAESMQKRSEMICIT